MQRLIDANKFEVVALQEKSEEFCNGVMWILEQIDNASTVLTIPDNPTNGDIIKVMFPEVFVTNCKLVDKVGYFNFDVDWWNSPYKERRTKMKFTIANALAIIDKYKAESTKKMGMTSNNLCNSCTNVEAIPKDQYEARLKADMVAMLTAIQLEIEELNASGNDWSYMNCSEIIQQKINSLKENKK